MESRRARLVWTLTIALSALAASAAATEPILDTPRGPITLRDALAAALLGNPELAASAQAIRVEEARALQAGRLPNPELAAAVENIGGSGERQSFETTETTLVLSQLLELGGKRGKRELAAGLARDTVAWDYAVRRAHVLAATTKAFVAVLERQDRVGLGADLARLADEAARAVDAQVHAGAGSPAEAARARIAVGQAQLERARADRELAVARAELAAFWGETAPGFDRALGELASIGAPPTLDRLAAELDAAPDLARWQTEHTARAADLALEQAQAIPDLTVGAGPRYFSDNGDVALVVELSLPLPVFDRNQGNIAAARARLVQAAEERRAAGTAARLALTRAYEDLRGARERIDGLRDSVLPAAERALVDTRAAYSQGALRSIDVLDAQRTLFELRGDYIGALADYHRARAELDRLAGEPAQSEAP